MTSICLIKRPRATASGKRHYWFIRWTDSGGRQRYESLGRADVMLKKEAVARLKDKELQFGTGKARRDKAPKMTLRQFHEHDTDTIQGDVRGSTLIEHSLAFRHALAALGDDIKIDAIGWPEVGKIKTHLANRSAATVRKTINTLRGAFNRARKQGLIIENAFAAAGLPKVESRPMRVFSKPEVARMLKASDLWWATFIKLASTSGLRKNELLNLKWGDISFEEATVAVKAKRAETITIGDRKLHTWDWRPKARASVRTVPVPNDTIKLLQRLQLKQGPSPFVFLTLDRLAAIGAHVQDGQLPAKFDLVPNMIRDFTVIQKQAAGEDAWTTGCLHDLRRTYCTWMATVVPMHVLKEWAGHSDIQTTDSFYLAVTDDVADRARQALAG